jgi:hypothetical protein
MVGSSGVELDATARVGQRRVEKVPSTAFASAEASRLSSTPPSPAPPRTPTRRPDEWLRLTVVPKRVDVDRGLGIVVTRDGCELMTQL